MFDFNVKFLCIYIILIMLSCCRSLVSRLEEVDPRKLNNNEKLAFWINVHNTLVMHVSLSPFYYIRSFSMIGIRLWSIICFLIGVFGLRGSTEQCKEGVFTFEGKRVSLQVLLWLQNWGLFSHLLSFTIQAAYNIGGHTISADTMQSSILGCRMSRPGQVDPTETTIKLLFLPISYYTKECYWTC